MCIMFGDKESTPAALQAIAQGELDALAEDAGLSVEDCVGCEGLAAYLPMDHLE